MGWLGSVDIVSSWRKRNRWREIATAVIKPVSQLRRSSKFVIVSHPFPGGLTYAAPTALVRRFTVRKEPAGRRRYEKRASRRDVKGAQGFLISVSDAPVPFQ
jgi:hypothetical protein